MPDAALIVLAGAFAGGMVSGLTGFGTGITALPVWLLGLSPVVAGPLVVVCSLIAQFQTLPAIWHAIDFRRCMPFVAGGLLGVPAGVAVLPYLPLALFKGAVGTLLVLYCGYTLFGRARLRVERGGRAADALVGLGGGVLGGIAGLSGPLPTVWAGLRGWDKDVKRGVFQAYNTAILAFALVSQAATGLVTRELGAMVLVALPGTILGAWLGRRIYSTFDNAQFEKAVMGLLTLSGALLILSALHTSPGT